MKLRKIMLPFVLSLTVIGLVSCGAKKSKDTTGGNTGGSSSGETGGNTGGSTGGSTGGETGGGTVSRPTFDINSEGKINAEELVLKATGSQTSTGMSSLKLETLGQKLQVGFTADDMSEIEGIGYGSARVSEAGSVAVHAALGQMEGGYIEFDKTQISKVQIDGHDADYKNYYIYDSNGDSRIQLFGLTKGSHTIKLVPATGTPTTVTMQVVEYDRSGYAHFNYTDGVGAYNDDGTLKDNAIVLYVTEETKNTVELSYGGITVKGIGNILNSAGATPRTDVKNPSKILSNVVNTNQGILKKLAENNIPLVVRIVGKVSNITNISDPGSKQTIEGLTAYDSYDCGGTEGDSGSLVRMKSAKDVTIEGVGGDANVDGWGFHFICENGAPQLGKSFEVRNISFTNVPEDSVGMEGQQKGNDISASVERCWIHNNRFKGANFTLAAESDKKEGDGSVDFKRGQYFTCSYNYFEACHKTNLVGSSDDSLQYNLTYHHNYWYLCKARGPLARQANIHMYNNLFEQQTDYCMNPRANAFIFSESNIFLDCKNPQTLDSGGVVKSYNDSFSSVINDNQGTVVADKLQIVPNKCNFAGRNIDYSKFETESSKSYIPTNDYQVQNNTSNARRVIQALAGTLKDDGKLATEITEADGNAIIGNQTIHAVTANKTESNLKITKAQYVFTLDATYDCSVAYSDENLSGTGCLIKATGECIKIGSFSNLKLGAGTYILQPYNFQAGAQVGLKQVEFKSMTITSLSFVKTGESNVNVEPIIKAEYEKLMANIPATLTFTVDTYNKIVKAINAYNTLENKTGLVDPTDKLNELKTLAKTQVEETVNNLGIITKDSKDSIDAAKAKADLYNKMFNDTISNLNKIDQAYQEYAQFAVDDFKDTVSKIEEVTLNSKYDIEKAYSIYENLTDAQKTLVKDEYAVLNNMITAYNKLYAVANCHDLICDLESDISGLESAEEAYNNLSAEDKAKVSNAANITAHKITYTIALIDAIPETITFKEASAIKAANTMYESLSSTEKEKVTNVAKLMAAKEAFDDLGIETIASLNTDSENNFADRFTVTNAGGATYLVTAKGVNTKIMNNESITVTSNVAFTNISSIALKINSEDKGTTTYTVYTSLDNEVWTEYSVSKNASNTTDQEYTTTTSITGPVYVKVVIKCTKGSQKSCNLVSIKVN